MYQCTFKYADGSDIYWVNRTVIKLWDADNAEELQNKIDSYIRKNNHYPIQNLRCTDIKKF